MGGVGPSLGLSNAAGGLMNSSYAALTTAYSNSIATSNLFDSDLIFQKLITFIADFIYIIYDRISDCAMVNVNYDINDELAIFSFSILIHALSIGLENNQKIKFSSLFRTNLSLIRQQVI